MYVFLLVLSITGTVGPHWAMALLVELGVDVAPPFGGGGALWPRFGHQGVHPPLCNLVPKQWFKGGLVNLCMGV